jgi:hypothetical protein
MWALPHQQEEQDLHSCRTLQFDTGFPLQEPDPVPKSQNSWKINLKEAQKNIG